MISLQSVTLLILAQKRSLKNKNMIKKREEEQRKEIKARINEIVIAITKKLCILSHCRILSSVYSRCLFQNCYCSMDLICLEVVSSFKCFVVYLRAFRRPSTLLGGWSLRTLIQPFISILEVLANAPTGCTWS